MRSNVLYIPQSIYPTNSILKRAYKQFTHVLYLGGVEGDKNGVKRKKEGEGKEIEVK